MTALGIIGIIIASAMAAALLIGAIYALLEEKGKQKYEMACEIIRFAVNEYSDGTRKLLCNIMDDTTEKIPNMVKGMYKTFEEDEEL